MPLNACVSERKPRPIASIPRGSGPTCVRPNRRPRVPEERAPRRRRRRSPGAIVTSRHAPLHASMHFSCARRLVASNSHSPRWTRRNFGLRNGPSKWMPKQRAPRGASSSSWFAASTISDAACSIDSNGAVMTPATKPVAPMRAYSCDGDGDGVALIAIEQEIAARRSCGRRSGRVRCCNRPASGSRSGRRPEGLRRCVHLRRRCAHRSTFRRRWR